MSAAPCPCDYLGPSCHPQQADERLNGSVLRGGWGLCPLPVLVRRGRPLKLTVHTECSLPWRGCPAKQTLPAAPAAPAGAASAHPWRLRWMQHPLHAVGHSNCSAGQGAPQEGEGLAACAGVLDTALFMLPAACLLPPLNAWCWPVSALPASHSICRRHSCRLRQQSTSTRLLRHIAAHSASSVRATSCSLRLCSRTS